MRKHITSLGALLLITFVFMGETLAGEKYVQGEPRVRIHPKVECIYSLLHQKHLQGLEKTDFESFAKDHGVNARGYSIEVELYFEPPKVTKPEHVNLSKLAGLQVRAHSQNFIEGYIEISKIFQLADTLTDLTQIWHVSRPAQEVTSEGVGVIVGANLWKTNGSNGTGIKIAVMDSGFSGLSAAITNGDFASTYSQNDYTGTGLTSGTSSHGTSCAEIIYDIAPSATYHILKVGTKTDIQNAANYCIANSVDIISFSLGWDDVYTDGLGTLCSIVNNAASNGILWVKSAGNAGQNEYWVGNWSDINSDTWHEFSGTDNANDISLITGFPIKISLRWDSSQANSNQDYDLEIWDSWLGLPWSQVASSANPQTGTQVGAEDIIYNPTSTGLHFIYIKNFSASGNSTFRLKITGGPVLEYWVSSRTITAPGDATGSFTVGAIDYLGWLNASPTIEPFSSRGPTMDSRVKPDICGPDNVTTFSAPSCQGTSFAAPHVAGITALVWQQFPSLTLSQLKTLLESWAYDCGTSGKDSTFGSGEIELPTAAPVSNFTATPLVIKVGENVTFTSSSTGLFNTGSWDFGDTSGSSATNPTHTYTSSGYYTVSLTVSGPTGSDIETKSSYIQVTPDADFTATPTSGPGELSVTFTDSTVGQVTGWAWILGDGQTSILQNPTHNYSASGLFTVTLTVSGPHGGDSITKTNYISVAGPTCNFTATPTSGMEPLSVGFASSTIGTITTYAWDFGDGGNSAQQNPTHVFGPGTFSVSLTVTGPSGTDVETKVAYVSVSALPPPPESDSGGCSCSPKRGSTSANTLLGLLLPYLLLIVAIVIIKKCYTQQKAI